MKNKTAKELIADERKRQIEVEGWTPRHDDEHIGGEMHYAAETYVRAATIQQEGVFFDVGIIKRQVQHLWPWELSWLKINADPIKNLVKAGALEKAERERLERKGASGKALQPTEISLDRIERELDWLLKKQQETVS